MTPNVFNEAPRGSMSTNGAEYMQNAWPAEALRGSDWQLDYLINVVDGFLNNLSLPLSHKIFFRPEAPTTSITTDSSVNNSSNSFRAEFTVIIQLWPQDPVASESEMGIVEAHLGQVVERFASDELKGYNVYANTRLMNPEMYVCVMLGDSGMAHVTHPAIGTRFGSWEVKPLLLRVINSLKFLGGLKSLRPGNM